MGGSNGWAEEEAQAPKPRGPDLREAAMRGPGLSPSLARVARLEIAVREMLAPHPSPKARDGHLLVGREPQSQRRMSYEVAQTFFPNAFIGKEKKKKAKCSRFCLKGGDLAWPGHAADVGEFLAPGEGLGFSFFLFCLFPGRQGQGRKLDLGGHVTALFFHSPDIYLFN